MTTKRVFDKFDFEETYPNAITVANGYGTKIPPVMPSDRLAIQFAIRGVTDFANEKEIARVIWIENTLKLDEFWISESLLEDAENISGIHIVGEPMEVQFDDDGNVIKPC